MNLGDLLDDRGVRRFWLADRLGVARSTVTRWAQGKQTVPADKVQEMHRLTNIPLPELLTAIEAGKNGEATAA
jgi:transcriptional regulator with XRE-family HTH domain